MSLQQWEDEAEAFHRDTGYLRPGKDDARHCHSLDARNAAFAVWSRMRAKVSDASRSERERAARVCDHRVKEYDGAIPTAGPHNGADFRKLRWEAEECARLIRSLPDANDNAVGADDKGEA